MFCYVNVSFASGQSVEKFNNHQINQIITNDEGVFLLVGDLWIEAEGLLTMPGNCLLLEGGKWVSINEVMDCDTYKTWVCRICGWVNPQGITRCRNYQNHPK